MCCYLLERVDNIIDIELHDDPICGDGGTDPTTHSGDVNVNISIGNSFEVLGQMQQDESIVVDEHGTVEEHNATPINIDNSDSTLVESSVHQNKLCWGDLENEEPLGHHTHMLIERTSPLNS